MQQKCIHLVGFGSQGSAWAQCLRTSGWSVQIYLSQKGTSFQRALDLGFTPFLIEELPGKIASPLETHWVAMLCPDSVIPIIYGGLISQSPAKIRLVLAHGFAVYSKELRLKYPLHQVALLAPKAIGPKLLQKFNENFPQPHSLVAALSKPLESSPSDGGSDSKTSSRDFPLLEDRATLLEIARGLGFSSESLVPATLDQETIGDLISEQGLLCGGIFNLLQWTLEAMAETGIPDRLIREECFTELELIAGLIRERGPATAFKSISQAAQCGTLVMQKRMEMTGLKASFLDQVETVKNRKFAEFFKEGEWVTRLPSYTEKLSQWESRLFQQKLEES